MKSAFALTSAALLAASMIVSSGATFAAAPAASTTHAAPAIVYGKAKTALAMADLIKALGVSTPAALRELADARTVTVYHVRAVYPLPQLLKIERAIGTAKTPIANLQKAVTASKGASGWFTKHTMEVKRLIALVVSGETISIYEN
jgi:hypothetical protein